MKLVLLESDVRIDPRRLGDAIAAALGITKIETRMLLRRSRGIVADRLTDAQADALAGALRAGGLEARVLSHDALPKVTQPAKIVYLVRDGDLLTAKGGDGSDAGVISFAAVYAVHGAVVGTELYAERLNATRFQALPDLQKVDDPEARELVRENIVLQIHGGVKEEKVERDPVIDVVDRKYADKMHVYLDLFTDDLTWWRMRMDQCTYKFPASKLQLGSGLGFKYLIKDVLERVAETRRTAMVARLVVPTPLDDVICMDIEEYNRYALWWLYRRWQAEPPAAPEEVDEAWDDTSSESAEPAGPSTEGGS